MVDLNPECINEPRCIGNHRFIKPNVIRGVARHRIQGTLVMGILGSMDRAGYQKIPANWVVDWQARHTSPSIDVLAISA